MKEKAIRWDGRSRIATEEYKKNFDEIFKKKKDEPKKDKDIKNKDSK
jgi:hypothetical protein